MHEKREVAVEDEDSAFTDGHQWTVRDDKGNVVGEWPTEWKDVAILHAIAQEAARKDPDGKRYPYHPPSKTPTLTPAPRPEYVAPEDWDGLPHKRPGLFRRTAPEKGK